MIEAACLKLIEGRGEERRDGQLYKLADAQSPYGMAVQFPDQLEVDEKAMALWIPIADGNRRDGVGDYLEVEGIRTERHRKNPIVLFDHGKSVTLPIAMAEEPASLAYSFNIDPATRTAGLKAYFYQGKGSVQNAGYENRSSKVSIGKSEEYDHALFCEQLFDLTCKRFVRSGSIGYTVIQAKQLQPDYERGTPAGLHLQSVWMLEGSLVVLPANMDTVRKALSLPTVCGKRLSPYLVKSLSPYAGEKKVQMGYEKAQTKVPLRNLPDTKIPPAKWRPGVGTVKDIREKYRPTKQLRRRAKKSVAGTSILHIDSKNIAAVRDLSKKKGLKCVLMGTHTSGAEKVKLIGDDGAIDEVAKAYGRPISRNIKVKSMADEELDPTAGADEPVGDPNEPPIDTPQEEEQVEKWGAQMSRHFHGLHGAMLKDLDEMISALENDRVAGHFTKLAENIDKFMTETETLWEKEYGSSSEHGYPPLEGAEDKDMGDAKDDAVEEDLSEDNDPDLDQGEDEPALEDQGDEDTSEDAAVESDSAPPEEPTPDEAVEGMENADEEDAKKKNRGGVKSVVAQTKDIRLKYRQKGDDKAEAKEDSKEDGDGKKSPHKVKTCAHCNKPIKKDYKRVGGKQYHPGCVQFANKARSKSVCPKCGKDDCTCGKKAQEVGEDVGDVNDTDNVDNTPTQMKGIDDRDMPVVSESHGFLGEISQPSSVFGEEHRMRSFHYHKALGSIGQMADINADLNEGQKMAPAVAAAVGGMAGEAMGGGGAEAQKGHPHMKMCKDASDYFLRLSREKAFGDIHREEARHHQGQLGQIVGGQGKQEEMPSEDEGDLDAPSPPDIGEYTEDTMKSMLDSQNQQIAELNKALASLSGAF